MTPTQTETRLSQILSELEDWRKLPRSKVLMLMGEYQVISERGMMGSGLAPRQPASRAGIGTLYVGGAPVSQMEPMTVEATRGDGKITVSQRRRRISREGNDG